MNDIYSTSLLEIMPSNLLADKKIRDICQSLDDTLKRISAETNIPALIYNIDTLDSDVIDILAWQFHVDFYDETLPLEKRRELVKKSIDYHRHKGTPYAVDCIVDAVFENGVVEENWEYGGEPYHFRVNNITSPLPDIGKLQQIVKAIQSMKNVRSVLDGIIFKRHIFEKRYIGIAPKQHKKIHIGLNRISDTSVTNTMYFGAGVRQHKKIHIKIATMTDTAIRQTKYVGSAVRQHKKIRIRLSKGD